MSAIASHQPLAIWSPGEEELGGLMQYVDADFAYLAFGAAQGRYQQHGSRSGCRNPKEGNPAAIGRPCRTVVRGGVAGQPQRRAGADQLDIDVKVVLFFPVPGESYLIAVRRKARVHFITGMGGEGNGTELAGRCF